MEKIISSFRFNSFLLLLSGWLVLSLAVGVFVYYDRASSSAMLLSPWHAITYAFLLLCVTLPFVYEGKLPIGGYSALMAVHGLLMTSAFANSLLFVGALLAGVFLDLIYARMFIRHTAWTLKTRIFSAVLPAIVWVGYLASFNMLGLSPADVIFGFWSTACVAFGGYLVSFLIKQAATSHK